jgi:hypothetical protein
LIQKTDKRFLDRYQGVFFEPSKAVKDRNIELLIYIPEELLKIADRAFIATALREGEVTYEHE